MPDLDTWLEIAATARQNGVRTVLTAAGVCWGMFMLLLMLGFGQGLQQATLEKMGDNATNAVFLWGQRTSMGHRGRGAGRSVEFVNADIAAVAAVPGVQWLAPRNQLGGYRDGNPVVRNGKAGNFQVMGDAPEIRHIQPLELSAGRFLNQLDLEEYRKVAVIGSQVAAELYEQGEDPVGTMVQIHGVYFRVVGVFQVEGVADRGDRMASTLHVPFTTFQRVFNYGDRVGWFAVAGYDDVPGDELEQQVRLALAERHGLHPDDAVAIGSWNSAEEFERIRNLFRGIEVFVWFVGAMTLLAGVVGVSNIMLIVVRERTKEIGLRRAIGATPASVVSMILLESVVLTAGAGYLGVVAGVIVLEVVGSLVGEGNEMLSNPQVDLRVALAATALVAIAGMLAGVLPARRAAMVSPVEALRSE